MITFQAKLLITVLKGDQIHNQRPTRCTHPYNFIQLQTDRICSQMRASKTDAFTLDMVDMRATSS